MWTVILWIIAILVGLVVLLLLLAAIGGLLTYVPFKRSPKALADEIDRIIELSEGRVPNVEDSDEIDIAFNQRIWNPELEAIRRKCLQLREDYPSNHYLEFCGAEGIAKLKEYSTQVRKMAS